MTATAPTRTSPPPISFDRNVPSTLPPNTCVLDGRGDIGHYTAWVENHITLADVKRPGWWANQVRSLRPGSSVTVLRRDLTLDVTVRILTVEAGMCRVRIIGTPFEDNSNIVADGNSTFNETALDLPPGYKVGFQKNFSGYYANEPTGQSVTGGKNGLSKTQATQAAIDHYATATAQ